MVKSLLTIILITYIYGLSAQGSLGYGEDRIRKKANENLQWLSKNQIPVNRLPNADQSKIIYTCDSTLLLKKVKGDTTFLWTVGGISYLDTNQVKKYIKYRKFGRTAYISGVNYQGNISFVSLSKHTFLIKNDSLFELAKFYEIPEDSVFKLLDKAFSAKDSSQIIKYFLLIKKNSYERFKLIFHPDLFKNSNIYASNIKGDKVILNSVWEINGKRYYQISIKNKIGETGTEYKYLFDENYKFLKYDGCNRKELKLLNMENKI